jgi:hypothetical protein
MFVVQALLKIKRKEKKLSNIRKQQIPSNMKHKTELTIKKPFNLSKAHKKYFETFFPTMSRAKRSTIRGIFFFRLFIFDL